MNYLQIGAKKIFLNNLFVLEPKNINFPILNIYSFKDFLIKEKVYSFLFPVSVKRKNSNENRQKIPNINENILKWLIEKMNQNIHS